ncbi:MAG: hypothetical protein ACRDFY_03035 [Candidatus Limnocylindria bacterium]
MNGRVIFGVLATIVVVAVMIGIGIGIYNAGVSEGVAEAARAAQAAGDNPALVYPPYVGNYGYGWGGGGFGFFGILFWILGFFLIFGLIRAAFGWGHRGGGGRGHGGWASREERIAEMHRDLHRRDEPSGSTG